MNETLHLHFTPAHISSSDLIVDGEQRSDTDEAEIIHPATPSLKNPAISASWRLHCREISSFAIFKMDQIARRYAPLSRDHIPGFPNKIPKIDWSRNLPTFNDDGKKDAALHLVRFHMHIRKFKIDFPEDCLMKIFLATLEGKAQSWYENLPPSCIYCLKDFHALFIERYQASYPSLNLVHDCCKHAYSFIESLEKYYKDDNFMDIEIMEALYEYPFQQHEENLEDSHRDNYENLQQDQDLSTVENETISHLDSQQELHEMDQQYEENLNTPSLEINEDNHCLNKRKQKVSSPLSEGEIDLLLRGLVSAQVNVEMQCAHGQEDDGGPSSFSEKEGFVVETIDKAVDPNVLMPSEQSLYEEVIQSVYEKQDDIFIQVSETVPLDEFMVDDRNVIFALQESAEVSFLMIEECNKELDNLVMIPYEDDLPYCQTTENHSIQDYLSDSSYVSCAEMLFQEEICSSTCSEFFEAHEHTLSEAHDEGRSEFETKDTLFFQQEVAMSSLHVFQDPMADLLQSAVKVLIVVFSDDGDHGQLRFWMPSYQYLLLIMRSDWENQSRRHLLDWLHWHYDIV